MDERRYPRGEDPYLEWHRLASTSQYLGHERAKSLGLIDIDCLEYCRGCSEPIALVETTMKLSGKHTNVMQRLAQRANLPAYLLEYHVDQHGCVDGFQLIMLTAETFEEAARMTNRECAEWLWSLRVPHWAGRCANRSYAIEMLTHADEMFTQDPAVASTA